jgi:hypothetical protein
MGLIREPKGIDLVVGPSVLTEQDKQMISEIITNYKRTGKLPAKPAKTQLRKRRGISTKNKIKKTVFLRRHKKLVK